MGTELIQDADEGTHPRSSMYPAARQPKEELHCWRQWSGVYEAQSLRLLIRRRRILLASNLAQSRRSFTCGEIS